MRSFFLTSLLTFACLASFLAQTNTDTTFKTQIASYKDGTYDLFYRLVQQRTTQLKLEPLQKGYDSLQIRIWYECNSDTLRKLLILKRKKSAWTATFYTLPVFFNDTNVTETIKSKTLKTLKPKNGWSFIQQLFDLQIATLPNMDNIPGMFNDELEGTSYSIEVATKKYYRFYGYQVPAKFQQYWQVQKMLEIMKVIETEFGIPLE